MSTHKSRIQEKLQLPNTAALIRYGLEHRLDKDDDSGFDTLPDAPETPGGRRPT